MQRTPSFNTRQASPTVHQSDLTPLPSHAVLPKRAARKANRQRAATTTATATTTSSSYPGAMQALVQFRSSGLRRMQRTPSFNANRTSPTVHQADRSPHQIITHYRNELRAKPTDGVQQLRRRPPHLTREPCEPWCNSGHHAFNGCNGVRFSTLTERRLPSTKRTVAPTKSSRTTQTICAQSQPTTCSNYDGNDDGIPRTSPGSHATPDAISAIQPPTNATHAVFQHLASVAYRPPKRP